MSCLFNSLQHFIGEDSYTIRQKICDYLQENKPIISGLDTTTVISFEQSNYIRKMRLPSTWGGAIEIQAACNIWQLRIIVKNYRIYARRGPNKDIEFLPISGIYNKTIQIYWTGGHYEPVPEK
jgi:hypothetical protein